MGQEANVIWDKVARSYRLQVEELGVGAQEL